MESLLSQLNAVPGVVGTLLSDPEGTPLAHAFPPLFDASLLRQAARVLGGGVAGLETVCGRIDMIDLRYGEARIVVRPVAGGRLLFLCTAAMNLQPLAISAAVAVPRIEKLLAARPTPAPEGTAPVVVAEVGRLHEMVQRIDALIAHRGLDRFKVRGEIAIRAGFALDFVDPDTLDEPETISRLAAAASAVLGEPV
jgi:predicted regulator of Ras-like GTPase activity (Roadblock/LC7/MglB family)